MDMSPAVMIHKLKAKQIITNKQQKIDSIKTHQLSVVHGIQG